MNKLAADVELVAGESLLALYLRVKPTAQGWSVIVVATGAEFRAKTRVQAIAMALIALSKSSELL